MSEQRPRHLFGEEHVRRYQETNGEVGHDWIEGAPTLILTTTGRRSGSERHNALIYGRDGDNYVVVASKGGAPKPPAWYLNLQAHPDVMVQVKHERFRAHARTASAEDKARLWPVMNEIWPHYDEYQRKTDREIPVVLLERIER